MHFFAKFNGSSIRKIVKPIGKVRKSKKMDSSENLYNKIDTFVFFDLETTGLIQGTKMPKITELSMVASHRNDIKSDKRNKMALPRVLHKLTIPICPMTCIHPQASFISNLWNDNLDNVKPFDKNTYNMIMQFIERLPGLICFAAHNGNLFDYPIFLSEIHQINETFPDRVLCIDTRTLFDEFFKSQETVEVPNQIIPEGTDEVDEDLTVLKTKKYKNDFDDNWDKSLYSVLDDYKDIKITENEKHRLPSFDYKNEKSEDVLDSITKSKEINFQSSTSVTPINSKAIQKMNEKTPENQIIRNSNKSSVSASNKVIKQLNFGVKKPKNLKLSTIYMHMIGSEPDNAHYAEGDCLNLLRCACQIGPAFAEWADNNAVSLTFFKKKVIV